jgi:AraC-like DNA-binding protein
MDLLTDILLQSGLQRRLLDLRHLADHSALRFPCQRSIGFHVVLQGRAFIHGIEGETEPLALQAGDMALMARGCEHIVSTHATAPAEPVAVAGSADDAAGAIAAPGALQLISGAYQFWNPPLHPLFAELPAWTVVRAESLPRLAPMALAVALLGTEAAQPGLGSESIVHGLLDVSFTYLLREVVERRGGADAAAGWGLALRAAPVRQAVELMHAHTAHAWTLDELARRVGVSRTALAEKFRTAMGDTPLAYLRTLRMQRAMHLLSTTDALLDTVAVQVGYTDAFSFSKVFKKVVGVAPREFRRRDAAERELAYRFG